jgi:adenylate cyclase class 2
MLEVEMKFKLLDPHATRQRLQELGFLPEKEQEEHDSYFNAPDRDFAQTDEALRIRQVGSKYVLTFKGPKQGERGKVRTEIEVPLADASAAGQFHDLLVQLGYRPVLTVSKTRRCFQHPSHSDLVLMWDEVRGLGTYVELEIIAREDEGQDVLKRLQALASQLQLGQEERRSYLELQLQNQLAQTGGTGTKKPPVI